MNPLDYLDSSDIAVLPDSELKTYLQNDTIDVRTLALMLAKNTNGAAQAGGEVPVSLNSVSVPVYMGAALPAQNIHGAKGTIHSVGWNGNANPTYINDSNPANLQAIENIEINLHVSIGAIDNGVNNRSTYLLRVVHSDDADAEIYTYYLDDTYIRDNNNTYDSGLVAGELRLFLSAGDKVRIEIEVLDVQTSTGTVNASETYSKIKIERITYQ